ncbi:hypothetical protein LAZ67_9002738, partial [Cordylochernes scorpioides]
MLDVGFKKYPIRIVIVVRHTASTPGFMVWGDISYESRTPLGFIRGTMTAQLYIKNMLKPVVLPFLEQTNNRYVPPDTRREEYISTSTRKEPGSLVDCVDLGNKAENKCGILSPKYQP